MGAKAGVRRDVAADPSGSVIPGSLHEGSGADGGRDAETARLVKWMGGEVTLLFVFTFFFGWWRSNCRRRRRF